jgi:hypothetical protein
MAAVLLLLFAALSVPMSAAARSPPPPPLPPLPLWGGNTTINVCTSSYTPMVYCDPDTGKRIKTLISAVFFPHRWLAVAVQKHLLIN